MSWTDQKPRVATEEDIVANWNGYKSGKSFRCYLCGHRFKVGDTWRWLCVDRAPNPFVCVECDGPNVKERWREIYEESKETHWWLWLDLEDVSLSGDREARRAYEHGKQEGYNEGLMDGRSEHDPF